LLADAGVGSGSLASVCANGNTTATGITITANGLSTNNLQFNSWPQGTIMFVTGVNSNVQGDPNLTWDNTNKRLGLGTLTPGVPLDIHSAGGTLAQFNGTGANNSFIQFQNAGVGKWRVGNLYNGALNDFTIYNNLTTSTPFKIDNTNYIYFNGSTTYFSPQGNILTSGSMAVAERAVGVYTNTGGYTTFNANVNGSTNYVTITYGTGNYNQLLFTNSANYQYTYPTASGYVTVIGANYGNTIMKCNSSTPGYLIPSMLSDDGTSVTSAGATRSNLYIKAANNTYYGQLAFTNGSNGSYGGISYYNASQWMQFEANSSEWMRLYGNGNFRVFGASATDSGHKFQVQGTANITGYIQQGSSTQYALYDQDTGGGVIEQYGNTSTLSKIRIQSSQAGAGTNYVQFIVDPYNGFTFQTLNSGVGNVGVGNLNANVKLFVRAINTTSAQYGIYSDNGVTDLFWVRNDGLFSTGNSSQSPYNKTTSDASNVVIQSNGTLLRSTSSLKYKTDVFDYDKGLDIIKQIRPVYYKGKNDGNKQFAGFIAEEINNIGLTEFVQYADDGTPDALAYANMTALLTKGIQQLDTRLTNVEEALLTLQQNLN
jgi:hypothetical protein